MRAAVLTRFGAPLTVRDVPDPEAGGGEVVVEVLATCVAPYAAEVFSGERNYPLVPPVVPGIGGVGRIVHVGPDATRLRPGDLVWCDSTVRSRDDALTPDITLQGWSSRGEGGARLARYLHDGSFAELMRVPTENVFPLPTAAGTTRPAGPRSACTSSLTAGCWPAASQPVRRCSSAGPPATSAAVRSRSRSPWGRAA